MKNIVIIILASLMFSCVNNQKVENKSKTPIPHGKEKQSKQTKKALLKTKLPHIAAYGNNVKIYSVPEDSSKIVGTLNRFDTIPHFEIYLNSNQEISKYNTRLTKWIGVKYINDTCWVKSRDSISFEVELEKFNQLIIQHRTHYVEISGEGYRETQVIDTVNNKKLYGSWLYRKYCQPINDSLYLFNVGKGNVKIYNTLQDSFIYNEIGMVPILNRKYNQIFYLKWKEGSIERSGHNDRKEIPCKLIMYNYKSKIDKVLYQVDSIQRKPYWWGVDFRYDTELKKNKIGNQNIIEFELYQMKPNPIDEGDFVKTIVKVDTLGGLY